MFTDSYLLQQRGGGRQESALRIVFSLQRVDELKSKSLSWNSLWTSCLLRSCFLKPEISYSCVKSSYSTIILLSAPTLSLIFFSSVSPFQWVLPTCPLAPSLFSTWLSEVFPPTTRWIYWGCDGHLYHELPTRTARQVFNMKCLFSQDSFERSWF